MFISRPGNRKLGPLVHSFSIPAHDTCPGETEVCASSCYAGTHWFTTPEMRERLEANWEASQQSTFVAEITAELHQLKPRFLRIHVAGDFYEAPYIRKWVQIAKQFPHTTFFAYTRSWRNRRMRKALHALHRLPNFRLWWSCDRDTHVIDGRPPRWRGVRVAWMAKTPDEFIPAYTNLVFRVYRRGIEKYKADRLVCPSENGVKTHFKITCTDCKLCFTNRSIPRKEVVRGDVENALVIIGTAAGGG